jgi:hypothetical protein
MGDAGCKAGSIFDASWSDSGRHDVGLEGNKNIDRRFESGEAAAGQEEAGNRKIFRCHGKEELVVIAEYLAVSS